jgi:toxin ParE1/3/4
MNLIWLPVALREIEAATSYIGRQNLAAAQNVNRRIREAAQRLAALPISGRAGRRPGIRELVIPGLPYLLIYRLRSDGVEILRLFHTARDPRKG